MKTMDLNMASVLYCTSGSIHTCSTNDRITGVPRGFDSFVHEMNNLEASRYEELPVTDTDDGCTLFLGLGPTPSSYYKKSDLGSAELKDPTAVYSQGLNVLVDPGMLHLGLSSGAVMPMEQSNRTLPASVETNLHPSGRIPVMSVVDEGSTSAKKSLGGYMPSLLLAPRLEATDGPGRNMSENSAVQHQHQLQVSSDISASNENSIGAVSDTKTADSMSDSRNNLHQPKRCRLAGCPKGARGASGLCIAHGGGQRCHKPGCNKGAESRTAFCKSHGGGRRCQELGCTKSAEGRTEYCIAHGGGRRCGQEGCNKAARGKSGLCIRHGGGKRCTIEGCTRSAEGQAGLCISHGGGRRCQFPDCNKGAQGSTMHCKAHGGGKRCIFEGCTKGAEGSTPLCKGHGGGKRCLYEGGGLCPKSVHGGTDYCVAHGGGKRCAVAGCTKSARGRTDCCVRHGGGKRCKVENCGKSAQGSTEFCKAHGGGKRCNWPDSCEKFARGKSGLCAAHGSLAASQRKMEAEMNGNMITRELFHNIVSASMTIGGGGSSNLDNEYTSSGVSASSESNTRRVWNNNGPRLAVPEGRVHGGGLLSLLGGNFYNVGVNIEDPMV